MTRTDYMKSLHISFHYNFRGEHDTHRSTSKRTERRVLLDNYRATVLPCYPNTDYVILFAAANRSNMFKLQLVYKTYTVTVDAGSTTMEPFLCYNDVGLNQTDFIVATRLSFLSTQLKLRLKPTGLPAMLQPELDFHRNLQASKVTDSPASLRAHSSLTDSPTRSCSPQ